jgi:peptidoglycan/LPS O-acetylase OafA/YrhL
MSSSRQPAIDTLTSFRVLAALPVVGVHFLGLGFPPWGVRLFEPFRYASIAAMTFFFVLSGFILSYNYRGWFDRLSAGRVRDFYALRFARLYPVHVLTLVMSLWFIDYWGHLYYARGQTLWKTAAGLTFVSVWVPDVKWCCWFNPVAWSLGAEAFFYLTFPLWMRAFSRGPHGRGRLLLAGGLWALEIALAFTFRKAWCSEWLLYACPGVRLLDFLIGVLLGLHFSERRDRAAASPPAPARWRTLAEVAAVLFVVVTMQGRGVIRLPHPVYLQGYFTPAFAVLIYVFAAERGALSRRLACRPMVYLGEMSFALYMLHAPLVLNFTHLSWLAWAQSWHWAVKWAVMAALSFGLSALVFSFYETPLRRRLVGWLRTRKPKPPAQTDPVVPRRAA